MTGSPPFSPPTQFFRNGALQIAGVRAASFASADRGEALLRQADSIFFVVWIAFFQGKCKSSDHELLPPQRRGHSPGSLIRAVCLRTCARAFVSGNLASHSLRQSAPRVLSRLRLFASGKRHKASSTHEALRARGIFALRSGRSDQTCKNHCPCCRKVAALRTPQGMNPHSPGTHLALVRPMADHSASACGVALTAACHPPWRQWV